MKPSLTKLSYFCQIMRYFANKVWLISSPYFELKMSGFMFKSCLFIAGFGILSLFGVELGRGGGGVGKERSSNSPKCVIVCLCY